MNKAQATVVQYVTFFLINFTIFLTISLLFKTRLDVSRRYVSKVGVDLINNYVTSYMITSSVSCKSCDYAVVEIDPPVMVGGSYYVMMGTVKNFMIEVPEMGISSESSVLNLGETIDITGNKSSGEKLIKLFWNRTKKIIEVS